MSYRSAYSRPRPVPQRPHPSSSFHPGVQAGLMLGVLLLVNMVLVALTGGTSLIACYGVQLLLYMANGAMAAYLAHNRSGRNDYSLPQVGAVAGLVGWGVNTLLYLIAGPILGLVTLGWAILGVAVGLICAPIDLAIQIGFAALGAWIYGRFAGGS